MNGSYTVATLMQTLFLEGAPAVARETGFQKRASRLGPAQFAQAVVMGWLADPDSSLDELAQTAAQVNAPVSAQAIDQRFTPHAVAFFKGLLLRAVRSVVRAEDPVTAALLNRSSQVSLQDSTTISLPPQLEGRYRGCGGPAKRRARPP